MSSSTHNPLPTKMVLDPALAAQVAWHKTQIRALLRTYHYRQSLTCLARNELAYGNPESRQPPVHLRGKVTTRQWITNCVRYFDKDMEKYLRQARKLEYAYKDIVLAAAEKWESEQVAKEAVERAAKQKVECEEEETADEAEE